MAPPTESTVWIRSQGKVWGPLSEATLDLMVDNGLIVQPFDLSTDGRVFHPAPESIAAYPKNGPAGDPPAPDAPAAQPLGPPVILRPQSAAGPSAVGSRASRATQPPWASDPPARPSPTGATVQRLAQVVPPSGRIEEFSPFRLYFRIAVADASGRLSLGDGRSASELWFKQGTPHATTAKSLGAFLVNEGALQEAELAAAIAQSPGDPVSALIASGKLDLGNAFPLVQRHAIEALQRALLIESGPFAFDATVSPPASGFPLGPRWELFMGAVRRIDRLRLQRRLAGYEGRACRLVGSISALKLTARELRLVSLLDGSRSLAGLLQGAPAEAEVIGRLVFLLAELEALEWAAPRAVVVVAPAPSPVAPAPQPKVPAARFAPKPALEATPSQPLEGEGDLVALAQALRKRDHFERLGRPRDASAAAIKDAYIQLAKRYHPDMLPPEASPQHRKLREDILALLNEAYSVLGGLETRRNYLAELKSKEEGLQSQEFAALLRAEDDFQRVKALVAASKLREALALIDGCIEVNDQQGELYAWRGYARFLLATDRKAAHATSLLDMQRALRRNPQCVAAELLSGHMAKLLGEIELAKHAYRNVLSIDPNNLEARRELRLFEQRKQ